MFDDVFDELVNLGRELYVRKTVTRLSKRPSSLEFCRFVSRNEPVVIENAVRDWPATRFWTDDYLMQKLKGIEIDVAITPFGNADAVVDQKYFVYPAEKKMTIDQVLGKITSPALKHNAVYYLQSQNDNLNAIFKPLLLDVESHVNFASEALARKPDAVNFWLGNDRSVTSLHKDHYENLYAVVSGEKLFILYPPTEACYLYEESFEAAKYVFDNENFHIQTLENQEKIPWIPVDPLLEISEQDLIDNHAENFLFLLRRESDLERERKRHIQRLKYPKFSRLKPLIVKVCKGDILYLPSLYYHCVCQANDEHGRVIAVNYWYDMDYDIKYNYYIFMRKMEEIARRSVVNM